MNGVYSGFPLSASNFEWSGAYNSSGNVWDHDDSVNADPAYDQNTISRITFTDLGQPGSADNTVTATLQFDSGDSWPSANATWFVDIDDKAGTPETETRNFYIKTEYDYLPATQQIQPTVAGSYTNSNLDNGTSSGTISNAHSGEVLNDETSLVTTITFGKVGSFYYLGGNTFPSVTFENLGEYEGSYTSEITNVLYSQPNHVTNFTVKIYYTPPQGGLAIVDEATMADLGHTAIINYVMKPGNTTTTYDVTSVSYPSNVPYSSGSAAVKVYGKADTTYKLFIQKKTSTSSGTTAASGGYHNFETGLFQDAPQHVVGTIAKGGVTAYSIPLPQVIVDTRYDITVEALNGPVVGAVATLGSQVPTLPGDAVIIHKGIRTLSVKPYPEDVADFVAIGATHTVLVSKPAITLSSASTKKDSTTCQATTGAAVSGKTKIKLVNNADKVRSGMLVMIPFGSTGSLPLGLTVKSVRRDNVVLSAACNIPAGTELDFVSNPTDLIPFTISVDPAGSASRGTLTLKSNINYRSSFSGVESRVQVLTASRVLNSKSITLDSNRGIKPGMMVTGTGISPDPALGYASVEAVTVADEADITLSSNQVDIGDDTLLTFSWPEDDTSLSVYDENAGANTGIKVRHIVATVENNALKINGYLQVSSITKDDTLNIHINDFVTLS